MENILALISAAFALLSDMDFRTNPDGTYTILDLPMRAEGLPIEDVRDLAHRALVFLWQDGIGSKELRDGLIEASKGGAEELRSRPKSGGFPVFNDRGNQIG